jgi:hypothetical protein
VNKLIEIQKAIEQLTPEERAFGSCSHADGAEMEHEWVKVTQERLRGIKVAKGRLSMLLKSSRRPAEQPTQNQCLKKGACLHS